jgi:hypothetical protein
MATSAKSSWKAFAILADDAACAAARELRGKRFLSRNAPRLPLPECSKQDQCQCKYRHLGDRRGPQRRAVDEGAFLRLAKPVTKEHRRPGERRERRR